MQKRNNTTGLETVYFAHREGSEAFLGELEASVMEYAWAKWPLLFTIKQLNDYLSLNYKDGIKVSTTATTVQRLYDKGFLKRETHSMAVLPGKQKVKYLFQATTTREKFYTSQAIAVLESLSSNPETTDAFHDWVGRYLAITGK